MSLGQLPGNRLLICPDDRADLNPIFGDNALNVNPNIWGFRLVQGSPAINGAMIGLIENYIYNVWMTFIEFGILSSAPFE